MVRSPSKSDPHKLHPGHGTKFCNVNPEFASSAEIQILNNQIKPAKMNKWPSRDRHRTVKTPSKPLRCVF
jgi:hypothetical protein